MKAIREQAEQLLVQKSDLAYLHGCRFWWWIILLKETVMLSTGTNES